MVLHIQTQKLFIYAPGPSSKALLDDPFVILQFSQKI